ncbi:MAG: hypothetical protein L6R38_008985 [Xanthoria sp. 2 TBL-2021]|nr:MAG: hypothetical protein L6R38_008985 [Xanthoria sp. 2 TBL-2021]
MTGVATALAHLHSSALAPDSRPLLGYHLDVKPENILIMNDEATGNRTWALSDFASSYFVPANAYDLLPPHPGLGTYEPPECCVFLECAAWLVEGSSAIHSFADDRLNDGGTTSGNIRDDYFFTLQYDHSMHAVGAVLRSAVTSWCLKIKSHRNSSRPIEQLVILIEKEFLLIDQTKRIASRQIGQCLQSISTEADKVNQSKIFEDEH